MSRNEKVKFARLVAANRPFFSGNPQNRQKMNSLRVHWYRILIRLQLQSKKERKFLVSIKMHLPGIRNIFRLGNDELAPTEASIQSVQYKLNFSCNKFIYTNSPPGGLLSFENFSKASQFPTVAKAHVLSQYHLLSGTFAKTGPSKRLK